MARFHKRHSLQSIDHNYVGASQHGNENKADHIEPNPFKARARDLGKRRGVILTENMNIGSSNVRTLSSCRFNLLIRRYRSQQQRPRL